MANWEQQILDLVNGSRAYEYDLELEKIGQRHFEFRSAGSPGADESAHWIKEQFESSGLDTVLEPFSFTTWNITSKPTLLIDEDGNVNSTNDQSSMETMLPTHLSWSTPPGDVFADLVVLPLPPAANRGEVGLNPINETEWAVDTTGKVVLIGKEVGWNGAWLDALNHKLRIQTPAAVIYTWWYDWMNFTPPLMSSSGGRWHWYLSLPSGSVDYEEGLWIRNREKAVNVSAYVSIQSVIGEGTNYNVVGKIEGYKNPEKYVIISGHYDTVVTSGFCDNGAGTAGVVELARVIADAVRMGIYRPRYTLVFVAFTSEELALVGSVNYIARHKNDMPNIVAVINLDCIGSDNFAYSETEPVNGFDLDQIVNQAAQDLGISSLIEQPGGSDHESFRD
ncbi:M28 family peptidase, partial [Candidatus Bathyarchaeota archaeon]|nr:M28 family peptidase [Candidatus Bathyarchaeota archaeon]